jgi:DNA-binding IclR family transcriptional regulator
MSLAEIVGALDLPRSSTYALLTDMVASRLIEEDSGAGARTYRIGIGAFEVGMAFLRQRSLAGEAESIVERVASRFDETAHLAVLDNTDVVYVAKAESSHAMRVASSVGARFPAHATGVGKVLLAQLDLAEFVRLYPGQALPPMTPTTVRDRDRLLEELTEIRRNGFAFDDEESTPGLQCLAVPIRGSDGSGVAALSLSVPTIRMATMDRDVVLAELIQSGRQISRQLGWHEGARPDESGS